MSSTNSKYCCIGIQIRYEALWAEQSKKASKSVQSFNKYLLNTSYVNELMKNCEYFVSESNGLTIKCILSFYSFIYETIY